MKKVWLVIALAVLVVCLLFVEHFHVSEKEAYADPDLKAELYAEVCVNMLKYYHDKQMIADTDQMDLEISHVWIGSSTASQTADILNEKYSIAAKVGSPHSVLLEKANNVLVAEFQMTNISRPNSVYSYLYGVSSPQWLKQKYKYSQKDGWVLEYIKLDK